ncbi:pyridoxamine 5'-phosphate oxidase family protein [Streptomyces sp. NPDC012623]
MSNAISAQPIATRSSGTSTTCAYLTTLRPDGRPHVVPVRVIMDASIGVARVITRKSNVKVSNVLAWESEARVAVRQVDGGRWARLEGAAEVCTDADVVEYAVVRYGKRYGRTPA